MILLKSHFLSFQALVSRPLQFQSCVIELFQLRLGLFLSPFLKKWVRKPKVFPKSVQQREPCLTKSSLLVFRPFPWVYHVYTHHLTHFSLLISFKLWNRFTQDSKWTIFSQRSIHYKLGPTTAQNPHQVIKGNNLSKGNEKRKYLAWERYAHTHINSHTYIPHVYIL